MTDWAFKLLPGRFPAGLSKFEFQGMEPRKNNDRRLTSPVTFRLYEDNLEYIQKISSDSGRPYREVVRDIFDEAIKERLRRSDEPGSAEIKSDLETLLQLTRQQIERHDELVRRYEQMAERSMKLKQGLMAQLREFAGILVEVLAAAVGARRLTWNYVAYEALKRLKYTDSQIRDRWDAENQATNDERDQITKEVKSVIRSKWPSVE